MSPDRLAVTAVYPGSFDPVTLGHLDIIRRGMMLFDKVIPAILINHEKTPTFSPEERKAMLTESLAEINPRIEPIYFDGLTANVARKLGASVIIRGIRAVSDYEYELQMALMNRTLAPEIETVFLVPAGRYSFVSSRMVKDVFFRGAEPAGLVPECVARELKRKFGKK